MTHEQNEPFSELSALAPTLARKAVRQCYSRCGWALFTLAAVLTVITFLLLGLSLLPAYETHIYPLLDKYLLLLNEALIAIAVFAGLLVLLRMPKQAPERRPLSFKLFFALFCICFTISMIGNQVGNLWVSLWNMLTGNEVTNDLTATITSMSPWQMVLCVGILAPIIEEFFFRKLLLDRLYPHSEFLAILTSGFLFGLFHQNLNQFFYTFGIGIVLAYLYCQTGSFFAVTLMHAAFNLVSGVLPALVSDKILAFYEIVEQTTEAELTDKMPSLLLEYGIPLLYYFFHLFLLGILSLAGALILIFNVKRIKTRELPSPLSPLEKAKAAFLNGGMITSVLLLSALTVLSLF